MKKVNKVDELLVLSKKFNGRIKFEEKRENIIQILGPFYHEDGDMLDIFLVPNGDSGYLITDYGMTLMKLSYTFDIETPYRQRILNQIINENEAVLIDDSIELNVDKKYLYDGVMRFIQIVSKVGSLAYLKREFVKNMFYEDLTELVNEMFSEYKPIERFNPIEGREELVVDYFLKHKNRNFFMFGVRDSYKAREATIACLEFQKANLPFTSIIVHSAISELPKADLARITNAADKQFANIESFKTEGISFINREVAP